LAKVELLMPDNKLIKGLAEPLVKKLKQGDTAQFERIGFVRLDQKLKFWFGHR